MKFNDHQTKTFAVASDPTRRADSSPENERFDRDTRRPSSTDLEVVSDLSLDTTPEATRLRLPVFRLGRTGLIAPTGPLNGDAARALLDQIRALTSAACRSLILDLRRVDYVDSQGARSLLALRDAVAEAGGRLRLVIAEDSRVERTLRLLRFEALFPTFRRVVDAWKSKDEPRGRSPRGPLTPGGSAAR